MLVLSVLPFPLPSFGQSRVWHGDLTMLTGSNVGLWACDIVNTWKSTKIKLWLLTSSHAYGTVERVRLCAFASCIPQSQSSGNPSPSRATLNLSQSPPSIFCRSRSTNFMNLSRKFIHPSKLPIHNQRCLETLSLLSTRSSSLRKLYKKIYE